MKTSPSTRSLKGKPEPSEAFILAFSSYLSMIRLGRHSEFVGEQINNCRNPLMISSRSKLLHNSLNLQAQCRP